MLKWNLQKRSPWLPGNLAGVRSCLWLCEILPGLKGCRDTVIYSCSGVENPLVASPEKLLVHLIVFLIPLSGLIILNYLAPLLSLSLRF